MGLVFFVGCSLLGSVLLAQMFDFRFSSYSTGTTVCFCFCFCLLCCCPDTNHSLHHCTNLHCDTREPPPISLRIQSVHNLNYKPPTLPFFPLFSSIPTAISTAS